MNKQHKCGLYLGRFQPIHIGHTSIINTMLDECETVIIAVGSAQASGTVKNPFNFNMRKRLIEEIYELHLDRIKVVPINDREHYSDDSSWGDYLLKNVYDYCCLRPDVIYEGYEQERSHWYDECDINVVTFSRIEIPISGTVLRSMLKVDCTKLALRYLPVSIHKYYDEMRKEILKCSQCQKI